MLEWVAYPFSSGSSQPRNQTGVSCIAGRFFTSWATREALKQCWAVKKSYRVWDINPLGSITLYYLETSALRSSEVGILDLTLSSFLSSFFLSFFLWPQGIWDISFPTRDQTHTSCCGSTEFNHCNARAVTVLTVSMWPWTRHFPSQIPRLLKCDRRIKSPARPQRVLWGWHEIVKALMPERVKVSITGEKKGARLSIFLNHISKLPLDLCWSKSFFPTYHSMTNNFTSF